MSKDVVAKILERSSGGLDVIQECLPQAVVRKPFKIRDERTASSFLKELNGKWIVTDFGNEARAKDCFAIYGEVHGIDFKTTLKRLCLRYGIDHQEQALKPKIEYLQASEHNDFSYKKTTFTTHHLKTLGPNITPSLCESFGLFAIEWYIIHKEPNKAVKVSATQDYPIFLFEYETFQKVYQPLNTEKQYRFFYKGTKPKHFVFGMDRVEKAYGEQNEYRSANGELEGKLDKVILCSGERDALNVASFGYQAIALNSETQNLDAELFKTIMNYTETLYNIPDLDNTGVKQGKKLALKFWDIKTAWIPKWLTQKRDFRGNHCKDFTDFCHHTDTKKVKHCIENALQLNPFQHHDDKISISTLNLLELVSALGYYKVKDQLEKVEFKLIQIKKNIFQEVSPFEIREAVLEYIDQRGCAAFYKNLVLNSTRLNGSFLERIKTITIDGKAPQKNTEQFVFFGKRLKIDNQQVKEEVLNDTNTPIPTEYLIDWSIEKQTGLKLNADTDIKVQNPPFQIKPNHIGELDIHIIQKDNDFLNFLINTSRVYWREEKGQNMKPFVIDDKSLTDEQITEQKEHLINKIYAFGYLLHAYKNASNPWAVFAMDGAVVDETESHGGTGKSLYTNAIKYLRTLVVKPARDNKLFENNHLYEGVTENTGVILFDDANRNFKFDHIFTATTGDLIINPKNKKSYTIPFRDAPKFAISTNYSVGKVDPSTARRMLITVFSDYYHFDTETYTGKTVFDDFGYELFKDWNAQKWNDFINFSAYALSFFLSQKGKINPPMENVKKRNALQEMGQLFFEIFETHLTPELNKYYGIANFHDFVCKNWSNLKNITKKTLTQKIRAWCVYKGYTYNPKELCNNSGQISKQLNPYEAAVKCFFIRAYENENQV